MRKLVICGQCEINNQNKIKKWVGRGFGIEVRRIGSVVLGEINSTGDFLIKRGGQYYTTITGDNFTVLCGNCGNPVYQKRGLPIHYEFSQVRWQGTVGTIPMTVGS